MVYMDDVMFGFLLVGIRIRGMFPLKKKELIVQKNR